MADLFSFPPDSETPEPNHGTYRRSARVVLSGVSACRDTVRVRGVSNPATIGQICAAVDFLCDTGAHDIAVDLTHARELRGDDIHDALANHARHRANACTVRLIGAAPNTA